MDSYYQLFSLVAMCVGVSILAIFLVAGMAIACVWFGYRIAINRGAGSPANPGGQGKTPPPVAETEAYMEAQTLAALQGEDPWENTVLNSRTARPTVPGDR